MSSRPLGQVFVGDKASPGLTKLLDDMKRLLDDKASCDLLFVTDDKDDQPLSAHRLILRNRCSAFSGDSLSLCSIPGTTTTKTASEVRVRWPNVCAKTLRDVISYVYTGMIEVLDSNVFEILAIALDMKVDELADQCKGYIREKLNVANACVFLPQALRQSKRANRENENLLLVQECTNFIGENAGECLRSAAFLDMDKESVTHVVALDNLALGEEDVWRCVLKWARKRAGVDELQPQRWEEDERKRMAAELAGLIDHVRILQIDSQVFAEEVEPTGAVPIQISLERYRFAALPEKFKNPASDPRLKARSHCKLFESSKIMSGERSGLQKVLNSLYGAEKQCWKLLFRASTQGFSAAAFHRNCDGHENTMTVVLGTNGHVCAGFTDVAWFTSKTSLGKCVSSDKSFLCSLSNPSSRPMRFDIKRKSFALIHHSDHGPIFGAAPDLSISDNCNSSNCISFLGHSYECGNAPSSILMGGNYFCVADYEVFAAV